MRVRNFKTPAVQAAILAASLSDLTKGDGAYSGDLTEAGAKAFFPFRGGGGAAAPEISNAKGSVKFWVKDGSLAKYEFKISGTVNFNGNDNDVDVDTTVEITNVGTTKVTVPDDALKILSSQPAVGQAGK
jgi:hypothetical protein